MNTKQIIKLIAKYSRVELDEITALEMANECKEFNIQEFLYFIKNNLDRTELQYVPNGIERFMKFCKLYRQELNAPRVEKAKTEAQKLKDKFYAIKDILINEHNSGKFPQLNFIKINGQDYFTPFEIKHLNTVGSIHRLIRLANSNNLEEEIEKSFIKLIVNPTKKLENSKQLKISVKRF